MNIKNIFLPIAMRFIAPGLLIMSFMLCAASPVSAANDPRKKLMDAATLYNEQDKPVPAERLIREAMDICQKKNDDDCLAKAYLEYGIFFRSTSVDRAEKVYRKNGFQDKSATFDTRFEKSIECFEKARTLIYKNNATDALINIYLNMGFTYERMKDFKSACESYDKSLERYNAYVQANPKARVVVPANYKSYEKYVSDQKMRARCYFVNP